MPNKQKIQDNTNYVALGESGSKSNHPTVYCLDWQRDNLQVSYGHRSKRGKYHEGGPFFVVHEYQRNTPSALVEEIGSSYIDSYLKCSMVPTATTTTYGGLSKPSTSAPSWSSLQGTLNSQGATGWRRARPGNPVAGALNFAAELRDLPTIPLRLALKAKSFASLGNEYLNVEFGWKPFVSDVRKMYNLYKNLDNHLNQLIRDNGRVIRRRRDLGSTTTTTVDYTRTSNVVTWIHPGVRDPIGSTYATGYTRETSHSWFVGAFQYYVPDIGSSQWNRRASRALFGANPTPAVIWEALPWSWLIDWFGNVGDVMSNLSTNAVDNLVGRYAYIMHEKTIESVTEIQFTHSGRSRYILWQDRPTKSYTCSSVKGYHIKARVPASPYGFGITYDGLSDRQKGILAALGISRAKF